MKKIILIFSCLFLSATLSIAQEARTAVEQNAADNTKNVKADKEAKAKNKKIKKAEEENKKLSDANLKKTGNLPVSATHNPNMQQGQQKAPQQAPRPVPPQQMANTPVQQPQAQPAPQTPGGDPDAARFEFVGGNNYNYGEIMESNEPTPHDFEFVNVGKKPLIIQEAHGSCGCTVPSYSKEPVMPGQKSVITVKYSTRGRVGPINKDVTITSNANPSPVMLHISGTVKANPEFSGPPVPPR